MINAYLESLNNLDSFTEWIKQNPASAKWILGKPLTFENKKIYLSSVRFSNEEDYMYCKLKFNFIRIDEDVPE